MVRLSRPLLVLVFVRTVVTAIVFLQDRKGISHPVVIVVRSVIILPDWVRVATQDRSSLLNFRVVDLKSLFESFSDSRVRGGVFGDLQPLRLLRRNDLLAFL